MEASIITEASYMSPSIAINSNDSLFRINEAIYYSNNPITCSDLGFENISVLMNSYPPSTIEKMKSICDEIRLARRIPFFLSQATGLPGNILALLTMLQFPRTTATFYLALLAVSDWIALVMKAINILMNTYQISETWSCKLILALASFTACYANWVLVLICFERLVTIVFPLKKGYYFTLRRAHLCALALAVVMFLFSWAHLWTAVGIDGFCNTNDEELSEKWTYVEGTLYSYLPSVLMFIMVLIIWRVLKKIQKNRRSIFCGDDGSGANALTEHRLQEQAKMERSITIMLLFASVTFIVLTLPICVVLLVMQNIVLKYPPIEKLQLDLAYQVSAGLVQMSHSVNFFIYFVSTERFRAHLLKLLKCSRTRKKLHVHDQTENTLEEHL